MKGNFINRGEHGKLKAGGTIKTPRKHGVAAEIYGHMNYLLCGVYRSRYLSRYLIPVLIVYSGLLIFIGEVVLQQNC